MTIKTLNAEMALLTLFPHVTYTLERLKAHPLGAPHVATFQELRDRGLQILTTELAVTDAQAGAQAQVDIADDRLDAFASLVSKAVLTLTSESREHLLYTHYFGSKTLSDFKRPVLGEQLVKMRGWLSSFETSPHPSLQALAPELTQLVAQADAATNAREAARQQNRIFRDVGLRRQWVNDLNAVRKEVHGALSKVMHQHTGLPPGFADSFFARERKRPKAGEVETMDALLALKASLQGELLEVEERMASLQEAEEAERQAADARAAEEAELVEIDKAVAALEKKRKALREKLEEEAQG
ncbi:hypothetical protein [Chondromyces apiculatus]|uniref:Uncharacterized protein n=1 Tax=Chondromyces apiculatus DSM 436 TaxID=1192034 RepID=A0A017TA86_9BACT|nr:hypothetical protein [Chondromyces apiculatus]EYF06129.1 Hypothetical protein CAP_2319 [Chondromyces apiculatus DSM 436]